LRDSLISGSSLGTRDIVPDTTYCGSLFEDLDLCECFLGKQVPAPVSIWQKQHVQVCIKALT
jgi:hypothetical protein